MPSRWNDPNSMPSIDLHRMTRSEAGRALRRALHGARVRGASGLLAITGLGFGNPGQVPVLRSHIEGWLAGSEARALGVLGFSRVNRGGALAIRLVAPRDRRRIEREEQEEERDLLDSDDGT